LRRPRGHFDGYFWTFPKGRANFGEIPEEAALREVKEETGYSAEIVGKLPGSFEGGTSTTEFFLMAPLGRPDRFDTKETAEVRWVKLAEAAKLIAMTTNPAGRARDLTVLKALSSRMGSALSKNSSSSEVQ
jgi:8-oxo-dGTP pyrophosphatase MutT (NUDIX family)